MINSAAKNPEFEKAEAFILSELDERLSPLLSYHNKRHTEDVLQAALQIASVMKIPAGEIKLLRIAALFHDAGFIYIYKNHEQKGCDMANEYLPAFHFSQSQVDIICGMIMATKIPQKPVTVLEQIIADADLDYLGREDVYPIAQSLFEELKAYTHIRDESAWMQFQVDFLKNHHYHTEYAQKSREPAKKRYLEGLLQKMAAGGI